MLGGYTDFRPADAQEIALFDSLKSEMANGSELVVDKVATQVVNGVNYKFLAKAGDATYEVVIYKKGDWNGGEASLTSVTKQ